MKIKKLIVAVACATAAVAAAAMLSACSGGGATSTGTYLSEMNLLMQIFYPKRITTLPHPQLSSWIRSATTPIALQ